MSVDGSVCACLSAAVFARPADKARRGSMPGLFDRGSKQFSRDALPLEGQRGLFSQTVVKIESP